MWSFDIGRSSATVGALFVPLNDRIGHHPFALCLSKGSPRTILTDFAGLPTWEKPTNDWPLARPIPSYGDTASEDSSLRVDTMCRLSRIASGSIPSASPSICGRCRIGRLICFLRIDAAVGW